MKEELNFGTSILVLNNCNAHPNKTPNMGRSLNVCYVVPSGVQDPISQELPIRTKEHMEKSEEKNRMSIKFNKRKSFSQVEMTFGPIFS